MRDLPAPPLSFAWGKAELAFSAAGALLGVRHPASPGSNYLQGLSLPTLEVDGTPDPYEPPVVLADRDELEVTGRTAALEVTLRHSFAVGWGIRMVLGNRSDRTMRVAARLPLRPGPGCIGWALAAGAEAEYSVHPADGTGPLLGGALRLGGVRRMPEGAVEIEDLELGPTARYVWQWQWDWYPSPRRYARARRPELPVQTTVSVRQPITFAAGEDTVILPPEGLQLTRRGGLCELVADGPGRFAVDVRSARGRTILDLEWTRPIAALLQACAADLLRRPRSAAGVVLLTGTAEALVVQQALASGAAEPDVGAEALDLFTARTIDGSAGPVGPLEAAYLCAEFDRIGDADLLATARTAVVGASGAEPGLGFALIRLSLALTLIGQSPAEVLDHAERQVAVLPDPGEGPLSRQAAALELLAVTRAGPGLRGGASGAPHPQVPVRAAALGAHLGAGLPGRAVVPLDPAASAQALATLALLPEDPDAALLRWWGCSAATLVERALPGLVAGLPAQVGEAHAWLALSASTG